MIPKTLCPLCGEGHLTSKTEEVVTEYEGRTGNVTLRFAECDSCGSEITDEADSRANKRAVLAFRKSVDGLLSGAEIRTIREHYGITQDQAARLFGGGPKAFSKYESGDVAQAVSMDKLLRVVRNSEVAFWDLVVIAGLSAEIRRPSQIDDYGDNVIPFSPRHTKESVFLAQPLSSSAHAEGEEVSYG